MSARVIRSKFLMDPKALSNVIGGHKLPTKNIETDVNNESGKETAYPAPPPIKKIELPKLVINIHVKD